MYFFYPCYADPPALHSFPTRRSSDLAPRRTGRPRPTRARPLPWRRSARDSRAPRSEEHTSELQSQFHLVCRLLLEKKNCTLLRARKMHTLSRSASPPSTGLLSCAISP